MNSRTEVPLLSSKQEYAYKKLKDMIISNELTQGTLLVERSLSEFLCISRTPIRAALNQLMNEGFLIFCPGRGMAVAQIDAQDVVNTYVLREVLDVLAIRLFIENVPTAFKVELEETVLQMEASLAAGNLKAVAGYDRHFHNIYRYNTRNKRLEFMLGTLMDQVDRLHNLAKDDPERTRQSVKEHRAIIDAVLRNDVEGAERAMHIHMSGLKVYHFRWIQKYRPE